MRITKLVVSAIAFAIALLVAPASPATASTPSPDSASQIAAGSPCYVAGYTAHARQRMAERGWTEEDVEIAVALGCNYAVWQPAQQTWRIDWGDFGNYVVINNNAYIITVW